jgi:L,D-transpeptidase YcbB
MPDPSARRVRSRTALSQIARTRLYLLAILLAFPLPCRAQDSDEPERPAASQAPLISLDGLRQAQAAIADYRRIAAAGGWPAIPRGPQLRAGEADARVAPLRQRLAFEGDLPAGYASTAFDERLEGALRRYQRRHGLRDSGILNGETLSALNIPAEARLAQLEASAQRMTELMPETQSGAYVLVNIPSYELQVIAQGRVYLYSRVIVGKTSTQTPSVRATVRAVDLMPYWHVPPGVAERAIIPAIRKDPTYLAKERIRVFSAWGGTEIDPATVNWFAPQASRYVFRQDPGPHNALGLVRVDMPNQFTVYMHDTPMKRLFASRSRPFSAGCVRVEQIYALAGLLIGEDEALVRSRVDSLLASGTKTTLKATAPLPVHFVYLTAWVDPSGQLQFRHDLYGRDGGHTQVADADTAQGRPASDPWHTRVFDLSP